MFDWNTFDYSYAPLIVRANINVSDEKRFVSANFEVKTAAAKMKNGSIWWKNHSILLIYLFIWISFSFNWMRSNWSVFAIRTIENRSIYDEHVWLWKERVIKSGWERKRKEIQIHFLCTDNGNKVRTSSTVHTYVWSGWTKRKN